MGHLRNIVDRFGNILNLENRFVSSSFGEESDTDEGGGEFSPNKPIPPLPPPPPPILPPGLPNVLGGNLVLPDVLGGGTSKTPPDNSPCAPGVKKNTAPDGSFTYCGDIPPPGAPSFRAPALRRDPLRVPNVPANNERIPRTLTLKDFLGDRESRTFQPDQIPTDPLSTFTPSVFSFNDGGVTDRYREVIEELLADPSFSDEVVNRLRERQKDTILALGDQSRQRTLQRGANRGVSQGGRVGAQLADVGDREAHDITSSFRDIDIQAQLQNRQDRLNAV